MATNWQQEFSSNNNQSPQGQQSSPLSFLGDIFNQIQGVRQGISDWGFNTSNKEAQGLGGQPVTRDQYNNDQNTINTAIGASLATGASPAVENKVSDLAGYLTKGGIGKKIGQAYENATANGVTDSAGDLATELRQAVSQKLGNDPKYANLINQRISSDVAPASIDQNPSLTPSQIFQLKQQAANRLPNGFLAQFQGKSAGNQVDEIMRDVTGKRAADITPGVKTLNKIYKIYSNPLGDPASIVGKAVVGGIGSQFLPKSIRDLIGI